ncbi:hypothetical protein ACSBR2_040215 [Camellia fascicularis]
MAVESTAHKLKQNLDLESMRSRFGSAVSEEPRISDYGVDSSRTEESQIPFDLRELHLISKHDGDFGIDGGRLHN